ncbi:MAG: hypothetical protein J6W03_01155 [Bacteroidaceae bacterium]|nr:hypothetical protein [Bacteroidaceae bacterium]
MKLKTFFAAMLFMMAGLQTAWAQKMIVRMTGNQTTEFNVSEIEEVIFTDSEPIDDSHEWVDLGLPSGTKWATCNVGANSPEEYGDYFAWGETESKDYYDWSTYKWCNGSYDTITKYCISSYVGYNGFTDSKTELDPEDDVAAVNWGGSWRMPTLEQVSELHNNCTCERTTQDSVNGTLVTGPNGNSIFLPAAGRRQLDGPYYTGSDGYYLSRSLQSDSCNGYSLSFNFNTGWWGWYYTYRSYGFTVRPVCP